MIWDEVFVDRKLNPLEIVSSVGMVLGLEPDQIIVITVDEWEKNEQISQRAIICETTEYAGEFPMRVGIYLQDTTLQPVDRVRAISDFCQNLGCRGLLDNGSLDPYSWLLVGNHHRPEVVSVNPSEFDNGIIVIARGNQ